MIPLGPVVARSRLQAARNAAWTYLADADHRAEWWPELRLDPQVGGAISERWTEETDDSSVSRDASGTVDVWVDGHAIGFTWREAGDLRDTAVLLTLRSQGAETGITVTETGFDALPASAERAAASQDGWQVLLRDLTSAIDEAVAAGRIVAETPAAAVLPEAHEVAPEGVSEVDAQSDANDTVAVPALAAQAASVAGTSGAAEPVEVTEPVEVAESVETGGSVVGEDEELGAANSVEVSDADAPTTVLPKIQLAASNETPEVGEAAEQPLAVAAEQTTAQATARGTHASEQIEEDEPIEPDFDSLIRGE